MELLPNGKGRQWTGGVTGRADVCHQEAERSTQSKMSRNASQTGLSGQSWFLFRHGLDLLPVSMTSWAPQSLGHWARLGGLGWHGCLPRGPGTSSQVLSVSPATYVCPGGPVPWPSTMETTAPPEGVLLGSCGCPRFKPACHGAAPAAGRHAHAALAPLLHVHLGLCPIVPMAGPTGLS